MKNYLLFIFILFCAVSCQTLDYIYVPINSPIKSISYCEIDENGQASQLGTIITLEDGHTQAVYGTELFGQNAIGEDYVYLVKQLTIYELDKSKRFKECVILKVFPQGDNYVGIFEIVYQDGTSSGKRGYYIPHGRYEYITKHKQRYLTESEIQHIIDFNLY